MSTSDHDGGWKYFADTFLDEFLAYTFPALHERIDWRTDPRVLDGELAQFGGDPPTRLRSDKLVQFIARDAVPRPFLLHIEFQSQRDIDFTRRMARYAARIAERYGLPLAMLAVLADESPRWRPQDFDGGFAGFGPVVRFHRYKLIDRPIEEVEADPRFAALFDLMVRLSRQVKGDDARLQLSGELALRLYRRLPDANQRFVHFLRLFSLVLPLSPSRRAEFVPHVIRVLQQEGSMVERRFLAHFEIEAEERGEARGEVRGKEIGEELGQRKLLTRQLTRRLGSLSDTDRLALLELPAARLPELADALFDFQSSADLRAWLRGRKDEG